MPSRPTVAACAALVLFTAAPVLASEKLSAQGGCATCHAGAKKGIGPSWHDIAAKYKGQADAPALLARRVREGSKGVWGPLPMAPTPAAKIGDADLNVLIAWVLKTP